jgi:hypothetical protein
MAHPVLLTLDACHILPLLRTNSYRQLPQSKESVGTGSKPLVKKLKRLRLDINKLRDTQIILAARHQDRKGIDMHQRKVWNNSNQQTLQMHYQT